MAEIEYLGPLKDTQPETIEYLGPLESKKDPSIMDRVRATPATAVLIGKEFLKGATFGLADLPAPNAEKYLSDLGLEVHPWAKAGGEIAGTLAPAGAAIKMTSPLVKAAYPAVAGTIKGNAATAGLAGMLYSAVDSAVKDRPAMEGLKAMGFDGLAWAAQTAVLDKAIRFFKATKKIPEAKKTEVLQELNTVAEERLMPTVGAGPPEGIVRQNAPLKGGMVRAGEPLAEGKLIPPKELAPTEPVVKTQVDPIIERSATKIEPSFTDNLPSTEVIPVAKEGPMPLIRRDLGFNKGLGEAGSISTRLMADVAGAGGGALVGAEEDKESPIRGAVAGGLAGLAMMEGGRKTISMMRDKGFWDSFRRFWNPVSTLPGGQNYLDLRNMTKGSLHQVEDIVGKMKTKLGTFDEPTRLAMFEFLDGKLPLDQLPTNAKVAAVNFRTINNLIGKGLVKRGELSQKVFDSHKDKYIKYMYAKHILDENGIKMGAGSQLDEAYLRRRQDLPESVRKAIGQIKDVAVAEPVSAGRPMADMVKFDMQKAISENPKWTWTPAKADVGGKKMALGDLVKEVEAQQRVAKAMPNVPEVQQRLQVLETGLQNAQRTTKQAPKDFIKMPESPKWGPLSGQFVRREIATDLMPAWSGVSEAGKISKIVNVFVHAEEKAMSMFKAGKTAFNVPTIVRNGFSNIVQFNMSGVPLTAIPGHLKDAGKHFYNRDMIYGQAKKHGLFKTNFAQTEIADILKTVNTIEEGGSLNTIMAKIGDLSKYYGKIDDFYKMAKFSEQVGKGVDYKTAAREANKWVMDYSLVDPAIDVARRHIMPFATYQYKMIPLVTEALRERPLSVIKYMAAPLAMYEAARETLKLTDDDWKQLKKDLPLYIKNNGSYVLMPWKSPQGNPQWVNLEYFFPWQAVGAVARDIHQGNPGGILTDIGFSNPLLDAYSVGKTLRGNTPPKDPYTGRLLYNPLDSPTEKAIKTSEWLYNKWMPSMLTSFGALGTTGQYLRGEKDKYGREVSGAQAAGKWVGFNIVSPTPVQSAKERRALIMDAKQSLYRIMKDPTMPENKKTDAVQRYQSRIREIQGIQEGE